jgi:hypothetical protein
MSVTLKEVFDSSCIADDIAVYSLKWHYQNMLDDMNDFENNPDSRVHSEDFQDIIRTSRALEEVLRYYGERI